MEKSQVKKISIAIIGSGISGLFQALKLLNHNCDITVFSKAKDPLNLLESEHFSSTFNGEVGRFITTFEGHPYLGDNIMYPNMREAFFRKISEGGWLGNDLNKFSKEELDWLKKREIENEKTQKISENHEFYISNNIKGLNYYRELIKDLPQLFKDTDLHSDGILRLYDNEKLWNWSCELHDKSNALERKLSTSDISKEHPAFKEACVTGTIAGGLEAPGITLNIQQFSRNIISYLKENNIKFRWETKIESILKQENGCVDFILTQTGEKVESDYYFFHAGAYSEQTPYLDTDAHNKIAGVAGRWLVLPRPANFIKPVKIHGSSRVENSYLRPIVDVNLTPFTNKDDNKKYLAVGGGYMFAGFFPFSYLSEELSIVDSENHRAMEIFLGAAYKEAKNKGLLINSDKICFRSFTPDDMPLETELPTSTGGKLCITGGTNTGTATIAPSIAERMISKIKF